MLSAKGYAGFWKRCVACIADALVVSIPIYLLDLAFGTAAPGEIDRRMALLATVIVWLYFALQESSAYRATPGKMLMGIVVTDLEGRRINFLRATGRHFAKIISGLIAGIGYLMAMFTSRKQGLHDIMAGTLVTNA